MSLVKLKTYWEYLYEYLKYGDISSIAASINYILRKKSHSYDRIIQTGIGKMYCRANTNDFQYANFHYEWNVKSFFLEELNSYNVFIDLGACVGEYSILAAKKGLKCFAFEPVKLNYQTLLRNLQLNDLTDLIRTFPVGLGAKTGKLNFQINPVNTGASGVNFSTVFTKENVQEDLVDIHTLDSYIRQFTLNKSDHILMKLDVEAMEAEVLKGASKFISSFNNLLLIIEVSHCPKTEIKKILNQLGKFEIKDIDNLNIFAKKVNSSLTSNTKN